MLRVQNKRIARLGESIVLSLTEHLDKRCLQQRRSGWHPALCLLREPALLLFHCPLHQQWVTAMAFPQRIPTCLHTIGRTLSPNWNSVSNVQHSWILTRHERLEVVLSSSWIFSCHSLLQYYSVPYMSSTRLQKYVSTDTYMTSPFSVKCFKYILRLHNYILFGKYVKYK